MKALRIAGIMMFVVGLMLLSTQPADAKNYYPDKTPSDTLTYQKCIGRYLFVIIEKADYRGGVDIEQVMKRGFTSGGGGISLIPVTCSGGR